MSFRIRVFLGGLIVALMAALFTGLLIRNRSIEAVEAAAQANLDVDQAIKDDLFLYWIEDGNWNGVQETVNRLSEDYDRRIALVDFDGRVIADSDRGQPLPSDPASLLDLQFEFGFDFGDPEFDPVLICEDVGVEDDPQSVEECIDFFAEDGEFAAAAAEFDAMEADSLFLYLGYPAEVLVDQGTFSAATLAKVGGLVLAVSALIAALVAGPMTRPIGELTAAVHQLTDGDLTMRVRPSGGGEMGELAEGFNAMADRLERSDRARRRMVSDVAHELRNPVGVMQSNLEAAQDGLFPTDAALLELLHSETLHLATIIGDLGELAQSDAGELSVHPEMMDLRQIAREVVEVASPAASVREIGIEIVGDEVECYADPHRLRQVIANLISNAVRHSPDGGRITVGVGNDGQRGWLEVADEGEGLTPEEADLVFDRFWRADSARASASGGAGLGLSICRSLVEANGGSILAGSGPGGGRFRIELPLRGGGG